MTRWRQALAALAAITGLLVGAGGVVAGHAAATKTGSVLGWVGIAGSLALLAGCAWWLRWLQRRARR